MRSSGLLHRTIEANATLLFGLMVLAISLLLQHPKRVADFASTTCTRVLGRQRILRHLLKLIMALEVTVLGIRGRLPTLAILRRHGSCLAQRGIIVIKRAGYR